MLGKIPPFVLGPVGVILVLVLAFLGYWFMVKPKQAEIARVEAQIAEEQKNADQKDEAEQGEKVKREWETSHESLPRNSMSAASAVHGTPAHCDGQPLARGA